jgi:hypothetical protein
MRIELKLTFTDSDGTTRTEARSVETSEMTDPGGEHRVAHNLFSDLSVAVGDQPEPKHNALARRWLDFPKRPVGIHQYFDIQNSHALWLELSNLVMGVEADLILAQAYKALEPPQEPSFEDQAALNDLYYVHDRKMNLLNQAVHGLIKVQDLVNRLLHESLGGDLVDTGKADWERTQLTRANLIKGLQGKQTAGLLSQSDFQAISEALEIPRTIPKGEIAKTYRNRLMHHVRPSVDYAMFFATLESRAGEEIRDTKGNVVGRQHTISARQPVEYRFQDLRAAFSDYLDAIAAMLQKLSEIKILR